MKTKNLVWAVLIGLILFSCISCDKDCNEYTETTYSNIRGAKLDFVGAESTYPKLEFVKDSIIYAKTKPIDKTIIGNWFLLETITIVSYE